MNSIAFRIERIPPQSWRAKGHAFDHRVFIPHYLGLSTIASCHPGTWNAYKTPLFGVRPKFRLSGPNACFIAGGPIPNNVGTPLGIDPCESDIYHRTYTFTSTDFHPQQMVDNQVPYVNPITAQTQAETNPYYGWAAAYEQWFLDAGNTFTKSNTSYTYGCSWHTGSDGGFSAADLHAGGRYVVGRRDAYPNNNYRLAWIPYRQFAQLSVFTSANYVLHTDWGDNQPPDYILPSRAFRLWASPTDVPPGNPDTIDVRTWIQIDHGMLDVSAPSFLRCGGRVWLFYLQRPQSNTGPLLLQLMAKWAPENETAPIDWNGWQGEAAISYTDAGLQGLPYESWLDVLRGGYLARDTGNGPYATTCHKDQEVFVMVGQTGSLVSETLTGNILVAHYDTAAGNPQWSTPVTAATNIAYRIPPTIGTVGPWLMIGLSGPQSTISSGSPSTSIFLYAHRTDLSIWTTQTVDLATYVGSDNCASNSYSMRDGSCNGTMCVFPFQCVESAYSGCWAQAVRILSMKNEASCGLNGFSAEGDHCVPGNVENCLSNCKCNIGYTFSMASAFGGCISSLAAAPMNVLGIDPPVTSPVAPVSTPIGAPINAPAGGVAAPSNPSETIPQAAPTSGAAPSSVQSSPVAAPVATPVAAPVIAPVSVPVAAPVAAPMTQQFVWTFTITATFPTTAQISALQVQVAALLGVTNVTITFTASLRRAAVSLTGALYVPTQDLLDRINSDPSLQNQIKSTISAGLVDSNVNDGGIGGGGIAGIVIAVIVVALIVIIVVVVVMRNKKAKPAPSVEPAKPKQPEEPKKVVYESSPAEALLEDSATKMPKTSKKKKQVSSSSSSSSEQASAESSAGTVYAPVSTAPLEPKVEEEFRSEWIIERDDLEIGERIGKGSFGTVYLGNYGGSRVAIKQCSMNLEKDAVEEFKREAIFMLKLKSHPSIVRVHGVCFDKEDTYLVLEYCDSGSLDKVINTLSLEQRLQILDGVAKGVAHLHRNGVVHRDLAARNVLLNETKHGLQAKVADFGMSRMLDKFEQQGVTVAAIGPVKYMAPESLANKTYSFASDCWTFAILVYEVLTGKAPHASEDLFSVGVKIRDQGVTPKLPDDAPEWLVNLCKRLWSMKPSSRPTMEEVVREFKSHVSQHGTSVADLGASRITPNSSAQPLSASSMPVSSSQPLLPAAEKKKDKKQKKPVVQESSSSSSSSSSEESEEEESSEEEDESDEE